MTSPTPAPEDRTVDELVVEFQTLYALAEETRQKMNHLTAEIAQRTSPTATDLKPDPIPPAIPGHAIQPQQ